MRLFKKNGGIFGVEELQAKNLFRDILGKEDGELLKKFLEKMREKYQKKQCANMTRKIEEERKAMGAVLNYIIFCGGQKTMLDYVQRRWDMYHTLSSTYHTLWLGLVVGILFRIYSEFFVFHLSFLELIRNLDFWKTYETCFLVSIFVCVIGLLVLFRKGIKTLMTEYQPIYKAMFKSICLDNLQLKDVFADYFGPQKSNKNR